MPGPLAIGAAVGGAQALTNIIGGLAGRREFPVSEQDIINQFNRQLERGRGQLAREARQRATASGLGGSGVISNIISDLQSNFATAIEQQRQQALTNLRLQRAAFEAQQPTTGEVIAGGLASGFQGGFNTAVLGGAFPDLSRNVQSLYNGGVQGVGNAGGQAAGARAPGYNPYGGIGLSFTAGSSFASQQPPAFVTQNTFSVNRLNPFNQ